MEFLTNTLNQICKKEMIDLKICKIDDEYLLDVYFYQKKDWKLRLFVEFSTLNVDFFTQALKALNIEDVQTYVSSLEGFKYFKNVKSEYKSIIDIFYNIQPNNKDWNSYDVIGSTIIVTNKKLDFIVVIDEYREIFYFYGNDIFINKLSPTSFEAYKDYYEGWYEVFTDESCKVKYFEYVWKTYIKREINSELI